MTLRIRGTAPRISLGGRNFTDEMAATGLCASWITLDPARAKLDGDAVLAVAPRIGREAMFAPDHATPPRIGLAAGQGCVLQEARVLDPLALHLPEGAPHRLTLAVLATAAPGLRQAQHLLGVPRRGLPQAVVMEEGRFVLRQQKGDLLVSGADFDADLPILVMVSTSGSKLRLRVGNPGRPGETLKAPGALHLPEDPILVVGADNIPAGPDRLIASPNRAWIGALLEVWVIATDILAGPHPVLSLIDDYVAQVYGDAA